MCIYRVALNFYDPPKKFPPKKKNTAKTFPAKIYFTVDILMVDIENWIESDSEDGEEYCLEVACTTGA